MSFSRLGVFVGLILVCGMLVSPVRADIVLRTLEAYAAEDIDRINPMPNNSVEVRTNLSSSRANTSVKTTKTKQANPFKLASYSDEADAEQRDLKKESKPRWVPEPSGVHLLVMASLYFATRRRRV